MNASLPPFREIRGYAVALKGEGAQKGAPVTAA